MVAAAQRQQSLLAHASRLTLLGEMASGLAHEINQPIAAIALYVEAGLNRMPPAPTPDPARDLLEKIAAQSDRANAIIQRMRCFARRETGGTVLLRCRHIYKKMPCKQLFDDLSVKFPLVHSVFSFTKITSKGIILAAAWKTATAQANKA